MKSWTNTVLALALLSTLSLAGCGTNEKTSENENQASSNTVETKSIRTLQNKPFNQANPIKKAKIKIPPAQKTSKMNRNQRKQTIPQTIRLKKGFNQ